MVRIRAPELSQSLPWLNCDRPLSLKALRGQIVLLDFWTYGCINCLHVIPDLEYLEQEYSKRLTIISIHTAKVDGEQNLDSIKQAILRYGITHPVVVDRERTLWDHYAIRAYPTFVLIDPQGCIVTTVAGEGRRQVLSDLIQHLIEEQEGEGTLSDNSVAATFDLPMLISPLAFPGKVLADQLSDTLFISDTGNHRIVMTALDGTLKAIIGTGAAGWQDGSWDAQFSAPQGMALDASGQNLYVADAGNHLLRQINLWQKEVSTLAGTGIQSRLLFPHGGTLNIDLNSPWDLTILGNELYVAMAGSHQIWVVNLSQQKLQTFMGTGAEYCVDGSPDIAAFAQPYGITTDGTQLFVADSETSSIRAITLSQIPMVRTLCGLEQLFDFGDCDGVGIEVQLQHCSGITYGRKFLWIADSYNHKIKQIDPVTRTCRSIAGGDSGFEDGMGVAARFSEPSGLAYANDLLYIADTNNHAIRCLNLDSLEVTTLLIPQLCSPYICVSI